MKMSLTEFRATLMDCSNSQTSWDENAIEAFYKSVISKPKKSKKTASIEQNDVPPPGYRCIKCGKAFPSCGCRFHGTDYGKKR